MEGSEPQAFIFPLSNCFFLQNCSFLPQEAVCKLQVAFLNFEPFFTVNERKLRFRLDGG